MSCVLPAQLSQSTFYVFTKQLQKHLMHIIASANYWRSDWWLDYLPIWGVHGVVMRSLLQIIVRQTWDISKDLNEIQMRGCWDLFYRSTEVVIRQSWDSSKRCKRDLNEIMLRALSEKSLRHKQFCWIEQYLSQYWGHLYRSSWDSSEACVSAVKGEKWEP